MLDKDLIEAIKELHALKEKAIVTDKEFEREKKEILAYNKVGIRWLTSITNFLKVGIWPFIVIGVIVAFYNPLKERLAKSVEFGAGGFYMKVQESARISGNEELGKILKGLSKEAVQGLLELGTKNYYLIYSYETEEEKVLSLITKVEMYKELERNGLVEIRSSDTLESLSEYFINLPGTYKDGRYQVYSSELTQDNNDRIKDFTINLNEKGIKAFNIIVEAVASEIGSK